MREYLYLNMLANNYVYFASFCYKWKLVLETHLWLGRISLALLPLQSCLSGYLKKKENRVYVTFTSICPLLELLAGHSARKVLYFITSWFYFLVYQNSGLLTSGYGRGHFFACAKWSKWVHLWTYIWVGLFYEGQFFTIQTALQITEHKWSLVL